MKTYIHGIRTFIVIFFFLMPISSVIPSPYKEAQESSHNASSRTTKVLKVLLGVMVLGSVAWGLWRITQGTDESSSKKDDGDNRKTTKQNRSPAQQKAVEAALNRRDAAPKGRNKQKQQNKK